MTIRTITLAAALAVAVAGCGGGAGGTVPVPSVAAPTAVPATPQSTTRGVAIITIPALTRPASARSRRPSWVSPSTVSLAITTTRESDKYGFYNVVQVGPTAPNCVAASGGARTCTVPFPAPPGVVDVSIYAYDASDPSYGTQVAAVQANAMTFTAGTDNSHAFVLGGIIGQALTLAASATTVSATGGPTDITVPVAVRDWDGNAISGALDAPLCVMLSDTGSTFSLTAPGGTAHTCAMPSAPAGSASAAIPSGTGLAITDTSALATITVHYNGTGADTAKLTIATTSMDSFTLLDSYQRQPIYQTISLAAQ